MSFQPNIDAALFLAQEVFPAIRREHPDAELRFVGRNPGPRILAMAQRGIVVTGGVSNMLPHLHEATVYVAPHFTGAGTRTKLLEAMAAGLPIVTTTVGIEGISRSARARCVDCGYDHRHDRLPPEAVGKCRRSASASVSLRVGCGSALRLESSVFVHWSSCIETLNVQRRVHVDGKSCDSHQECEPGPYRLAWPRSIASTRRPRKSSWSIMNRPTHPRCSFRLGQNRHDTLRSDYCAR